MVVNTAIKFTYRDYKCLPISDNRRYELIEGEFVMVPSPTTYHQMISINLEHILLDYIRKQDLGFLFNAPCDVVLSPTNVVQPDIFFIPKEQSHIIARESIKGTPDLIIEILSPGTSRKDKTVKRRLYARYKVKEYWIVDPDKKAIEVMALTQKGFKSLGLFRDKVTSPLLPGLSIDLAQVFSDEISLYQKLKE